MILLLLFQFPIITNSQITEPIELSYFRSLRDQDSLHKAKLVINEQIQECIEYEMYDSLQFFVFYVGQLEMLFGNKINPEKPSLALVDLMVSKCENPHTIHKVYHELATIYNEFGRVQEAYDYTVKSKEFAYSNTQNLVAANYSLANYAAKLGNIGMLKNHINDAEIILDTATIPSQDLAAQVHNLAGGTMYYTSNYDSALFFYDKALQTVKAMEDNAENRYYFPAMIKANVALIKQDQGNLKQALDIVLETIKLNHQFLKEESNSRLAVRVNKNLNVAYYNLSSMYFDLGDYDLANKISEFSLQHAKKNFPEDTKEYYFALVQNAESKIPKLQYDEALQFVNRANDCLAKMPGDNLRYYGVTNSVMADAYNGKKDWAKAKEHFEVSDDFYEKANPEEYDRNRFYMNLKLASVYDNLNDHNSALGTLNNLNKYISKTEGDKSALISELNLSFAKHYLIAKRFQECITQCQKGLAKIQSKSLEEETDLAYFDGNRAQFYLLMAKAKYKKSGSKDETLLLDLSNDIQNAMIALNSQKSIISTRESVVSLIENNAEVFNFGKRIYLNLYEKTKNEEYLTNVLELHEASLYQRIRARLSLNDAIQFSGVPERIINRERALKRKLSEVVGDESIQSFISVKSSWDSFLDSMEMEYPKYFEMRYASVEQSIKDLKNKIPVDQTIVRYIFVEDDLIALIINNESIKMYKLKYENISDQITSLGEEQSNFNEVSLALNLMYENLWRPFENEIIHERVVIIPDRELYNLSFESFTPIKIESFSELATNSLLSKYALSYNYSLMLIDNGSQILEFEKDFIAFAPNFSDKMKEDYMLSISDSIALDKTYLNLLPQPFNLNLVNEYTNIFNGLSFTNESSTKRIFTKSAREHKIIHIGTHAESNNISPELSRLIFAKSILDSVPIDDNSLYAFEIYDQNLSSNLAILTACETGKPTFQSGEGMISLAHAFNYAGSESILTGLWKIDEESSASIIKSFYQYLSKGWTKDKALQHAKLDYIGQADGRILAPQYWAGLVLIGKADPLKLESGGIGNYWWWILGSLIVLILGYFLLRKK